MHAGPEKVLNKIGQMEGWRDGLIVRLATLLEGQVLILSTHIGLFSKYITMCLKK